MVLSVRRIVVDVHVDAVVNKAMTQLPFQDYKALVSEKILRSVHECMQACGVFTQLKREKCVPRQGLCLHPPFRTMTQREKTQRAA